MPLDRLTLLQNAEVYAPEKLGRTDVLFADSLTLNVGALATKNLLATGLDIEVVDLKGNYLVPGLIDPHAHLLGGSGEKGGFSSQTPEISLTELTQAGITTVIGTLGVDTTMKTMPGLLARAKGLEEQGLSAYIYTGGYNVPPTTILESARQDIMFIKEVIAIGEIAIADERANEPTVEELAKLVKDGYVAGMLTGKAGVAHFHVGKGERMLKSLKELLDQSDSIDPVWLYPTHINRHEALLKDAVEFMKRGSNADMDVVEGNLAKWLRLYVDSGGRLEQLSISSDAGVTSPANILNEIRNCVLREGFDLETVLPLATTHPAKFLKLNEKGRIRKTFDSSFLVLDKSSLDLVHVISRGHWLVRDGSPQVREKFLSGSNREIHLRGEALPGSPRSCC